MDSARMAGPGDAARPVVSPAGGRSAEVASLLRSRRERLQPGDVGLPAGPRRRTRGLRREEVAQLASISTTYYTFLEQGRDIRPSRQILDAVADALRLTEAERGYLHELVHGSRAFLAGATTARGGAEKLPAAVADLVDRLDPDPAYVSGRCWNVLAANRAARLLWADWPSLPPPERNIVWWTFMHPAARSVLVDWEAEAAAQLARFRAAAALHPGDPDFAALIERLHAGSPEVRSWWPRHDVAPLSSGTKRIRHPALGEVTFQHVVLQLADDPEQKIVAFAARGQQRAALARLVGERPGEAAAARP
jgi:transcriptional regulator with XRE-family HTH domain